MVDVEGRAAKRQRKARIRGWIGRVICAAIAVTTASFAVTGAFSLVAHQSDQSAYDKAPYCASGVTNQTTTCVLRTTASVVDVDVSKNTGKNAHGYTTKVALDPTAGHGQWVVLSSSQDLSYEVGDDDRLPVLVWHDQITRFTFSGKTHDADENPHHHVAVDLAQVALCLMAATIFGRPLIRRFLRDRTAINLRRNRIPDWTLVALAVATPIAALLRASYVVVAFGLAGVAVLAMSAAWPFIPWVATPSATARPYVVGQRSAGAAKTRNQTRPKRLP
jgi:hypothetical protein